MAAVIFSNKSIGAGFEVHEFNGIPKPLKKKLIKLMARISERSYRRGVQQALSVGCMHPVSDWRYSQLDKSKGIDTKLTGTSVERLFEQNMELNQLGFSESEA